ncbi:hypothetical protein PILCRDRAFT_773278 [Piloderma croceum F 1598]|uniref:Phosphoglucomutase n=1 Tax=Piloderma croceum (strain F 1598) TaxID=765440 RepID=A0A0C3CD92_PILCF|nr:hypothetical protein PILCRDRAFT_773278 [Piloderma croceum F 1598]
MSVSLESLVQEWLRLDKFSSFLEPYNKSTRADIQALWDEGNTEELEKRMRTRIEFGTAGLRGKMEAGWSGMNDLIIIQASQGLCAYVLANVRDASTRGVVIGHDHRYNSERWSKLTAAVFSSKQVRVYMYRGLVHTPLVPFGVKRLNAACGVMITGDHNPKEDNGYKVYWENAVQIIGPHDSGISDSISANFEPWNLTLTNESTPCVDCTEEMRGAYFDNLATQSLTRFVTINADAKIKFVNSSMHGVGDIFVQKAFEMFGFPPFIPVKEQQIPDPEFPTVSYPNPEETGVLFPRYFQDLAMRTADSEDATYVLAQDPDADRFSAAERGPNGDWTVFTGDQLGVLFAARVLDTYKSSGKPMNQLAMVASTVSSKMIEAMAQYEGFKFVDCLTGFKYIGNTALDLVRDGFEAPFGYEEAIGFMFGSNIRDKDGVAATVHFVELVTSLHRQGKTAGTYLQELYTRYGYFESSNSYFICSDPPTVDKIFARIRNYDNAATAVTPHFPVEIAGLKVTRVVDLTLGYDTGNPPTHKPSLPLSFGHMIQFRAESSGGGTKIVLTIRTSGTEPKIKYYLEGSGTDPTEVGRLLPKVVVELRNTWMEAKKNNLGMP